MSSPSGNDNPLAALHEAAVDHGLAAELHADHVSVAGGSLRLEAYLYDRTVTEERHTLTLEIRAYSALLGAAPVCELFAGVGETREQAASNAFFKMLLNTFHVLIETLTPHQCDSQQVEIEDWRGSQGAWKVHTGPMITQGQGPLQEEMPAFLADLQVLFEDTVSPGPHWVRVFLGSFDGEVKAAEVLLDNQTWEAGETLLRSRAWPCRDDYQSLRLFFIALPAPQPSGPPTAWERFRQRMLAWSRPRG